MADDEAGAAPGAETGWAVLHLFAHAGSGVDVEAVGRAAKEAEAAGVQVVALAMVGHKADTGFMLLGPDLPALRRFQRAVQAAGLELSGSYVSLTEVSEYAAGVPEAMRQARLHPRLPPAGMDAFCFYPMSKRRGDAHNWYSLGFEDRRSLMARHGQVGRGFHGRVVQVVTGSTGLDDWEWGVSLFALGPEDLKACVYQMRFDPASALYAEFGPFWTGTVSTVEDAVGGG